MIVQTLPASLQATVLHFVLATFPAGLTGAHQPPCSPLQKRYFPCKSTEISISLSGANTITFPASLAALTWLLLVLLIQLELSVLSCSWPFQDFGDGASSQ